MTATKWVFWFSAGLVFYVYLGYPALLWVAQLMFRRPVAKSGFEPFVSVLIPAFNEESVIQAKVRSVLHSEYLSDRLEIVVACDGCTDETASRVREIIGNGKSNLRLFDFHENRGKLGTINRVMPHLSGEITVFSDAASLLAPDALRLLIRNFADQKVGAASGVYRVIDKDKAALGKQEDLYWKYETFLKTLESRIGSVIGAHGSLFAVRTHLFPRLDPSVINDDLVIPIRILQQGYRVAYEPAAVSYEQAHEMAGFGRRVRIMAGNIEQLREIAGLLWPPQPLHLFFFLSHKAGRVLVPLGLITLAVSSILLWPQSPYLWLGVGQLAFYVLAALGALFPLRPKALRLPYYFCMINAAVFAAVPRLIRKRGWS